MDRTMECEDYYYRVVDVDNGRWRLQILRVDRVNMVDEYTIVKLETVMDNGVSTTALWKSDMTKQ